MHQHGGDIYKNKIRADFSVNVNPFGTPFLVKKAIKDYADHVSEYPEPEGRSLAYRLAMELKIESNRIILTAGASEGFMAIVRALSIGHATVFYPCFFGYEYALNSAGATIDRVSLKELLDGKFSLKDRKTQALFIANPNNPDGRKIPLALLKKIITEAFNLGIYVIVDECFIELTDYRDESLIYSNYPNVIVVRSFTKTFAIPGARLGYLVISDELLKERLKSQLPEWNISGFALAGGNAALKGLEELNETRELIAAERENLSKQLKKLDFEVFPSQAPFILFKGQDDLAQLLLKKGILIRDCSNYYGLKQGYFRIAVKLPEENDELIFELENLNE